MNILFRRIVLTALLLPGAAWAQATFDVATIRPSQKSVAFERDGETQALHGLLRMRDVTLSTCIKWAYSVQQSQIIGSRDMDQQHYDVVAKAAPSTTAEQMRPMLRSLLTERFHLSFHREKRELTVYAMAVDPKGLKIKPSPTKDGELYRQNSATGMVAKNMTMQQLADYISGPLGSPLVDDTHLDGRYDLTIDFTPYVDQDRDHQPDPASILKAAFKGDLGLELVKKKAVVEVIVIDHVEPPTPN